MLLEQQLWIERLAVQCAARAYRPDQLLRLNFLHGLGFRSLFIDSLAQTQVITFGAIL